MERLQKVIANSGITSRRKAEELIVNGEVTVNNQVVSELGYKVSSNDIIKVNGKKIRLENKEYYLLNKPRGYICAVSDDLDRKVVTDLIDTKARIYPVGRLDYDTTGLILLTNDGELANKLMHPSFNVMKTYVAKVEGFVTMEEYHRLKKGIVIDGVKCIAHRLKLKKRDTEKNTQMISITVSVGLNHVIKKMLHEVGHEVIKLKRESVGFLSLGNLQSGEYRPLSNEEIKQLKQMH